MAGFKKAVRTRAKNVKQSLKAKLPSKKKAKKIAKYTAIGVGAAAAIGAGAYAAYQASQGNYPKVDTPSTLKGLSNQTGQVTTIGVPTSGNIRGSKHQINYQMSNDLGRAFDGHLGPALPNSTGSQSLFSKENLQRMSDQRAYKAQKKAAGLSAETTDRLAAMRGSYKAKQPLKVSSSVQAKLEAARQRQEMNRIQKIPNFSGKATPSYDI
jgi:hypothetical protein